MYKVMASRFTIYSINQISYSLREIFPTDVGQLSDKLKFLAGQNKILQDRRLVCYQITISFCQKSQDICQTNCFSSGQNENLPVLSDSPAVFAKTDLI